MAEEANITSKVKALLGITGTEQDATIDFVIEIIRSLVLDYINHDKLPPEIENAVIMMVVGYCRSNGMGVDAGAVTSVKRGDVSVSFGNAKVSAEAHATDFWGYKSMLNGHRRMRWGSRKCHSGIQ